MSERGRYLSYLRGSNMITQTVSALITITVVSLALLTVQNTHNSQNWHINNREGLIVVKTTFQANFENPKIWEMIKSHSNIGDCNESLNCLANGLNCPASFGGPGDYQDIKCIYDPSGMSITYDTRTSTQGLDVSGKTCNTFSKQRQGYVT